MAKTLPLPANQVGSPCDRRSPASGNVRQILRRRSTSGASLLASCRTGCESGFLGGGGPAVAFLAAGARFVARGSGCPRRSFLVAKGPPPRAYAKQPPVQWAHSGVRRRFGGPSPDPFPIGSVAAMAARAHDLFVRSAGCPRK